MTDRIADSLNPPYYAVVFTSQASGLETDAYGEMAVRMTDLARQQPGFLGVEATRDAAGLGITVSYWATREAIAAWREVAEHREAQRRGRETWYARYRLRVALVESEYGSSR